MITRAQALILALAAIALSLPLFLEAPAPGSVPLLERPGDQAPPEASGPVTLFFAGDVMLSRAIGRIMEKEGFDFPYSEFGDLARNADAAFANLETPVSTRGTNVGSIYSFRTDPAALSALKKAGFDAVSIANNHMWDYGKDAFLDTLAHLDLAGIAYAGGGVDFDAAHRPAYLEAKGHKIAFLAYTSLLPKFLLGPSSSPAVAYPDRAQVARDIRAAKEGGASIVIASFHWGDEYVTKHDASQEALAHAAIDAGAAIVMGHHPHTPQEVERYKNGVILYSLGNFIFDQNFDEFTRAGLVVEVVADSSGVVSVEPTKIMFDEAYRPYVLDN